LWLLLLFLHVLKDKFWQGTVTVTKSEQIHMLSR
jgi:hypothetical protein